MSNYIVLKGPQELIIKNEDSYKLSGLNIDFRGDNNTVIIHSPYNFSKSVINIDSNNSIVEVGASSRLVSFKIFVKAGDNQLVKIGKDFSCGGMLALMSEPFSYLSIGEDCMLSSDIVFMVGDSHQIYDNTTQKIKNWSSGIKIGNHVWIGRSVKVVSGAEVSNNSIVGLGSLVTKRFDKSNVSIGGTPAKMLSENIAWKRPSLQVEHNRKASLYELNDLSMSRSELENHLIDEKDEKWKKKIVESYARNKEDVINNINIIKLSKEYLNNEPEAINFICNKLIELGLYKEVVLEFQKSEKNKKTTLPLMISFIKALLKLDSYFCAEKYFNSLFSFENVYDYTADTLDILLIDHRLWDESLFSKDVYERYISDNKEKIKLYFYLLIRLGPKYRAEAMEVAERYLEEFMELKFFVDYFDILIEEERYSIAIEYIEKLLVKHSNSAWLFKKLMYVLKLKKDIDGLEKTYKNSVFHIGNDVYIFRLFIDAILGLGAADMAKKYLIENVDYNFDCQWRRSKIKELSAKAKIKQIGVLPNE